jgi:hypothetical protein
MSRYQKHASRIQANRNVRVDDATLNSVDREWKVKKKSCACTRLR